MAAGPRLRAYLALERAMVDLDDVGDPVADELRNRMDPIWLKLSPAEREALDARFGDPSLFAGSVRSPQVPSHGGRRDLAVRDHVRAQFARAA
jgi:hypothetical protein